MLREVYRTVPLTYVHGPGPIGETIFWITGIHVGSSADLNNPTNVTPHSPTSVYLFTVMDTSPVHSGKTSFFKFDGVSGQFIRRMPDNYSLGSLTVMQLVKTSRSGVPYARHLFGDVLYRIKLGATAEALIGEEPETPVSWLPYAGDTPAGPLSPDGIGIDHFGPYNAFGDTLSSFGVSGSFAIDETNTDRYIDGSFQDFRVFTLSTGEHRYSIKMPFDIADLALEDATRIYILLKNRTLILFDYERGETLGAVKIPTLNLSLNSSDLRMSWDPVFKRVLIGEVTPDNEDGTSTTRIRGFRTVPEPTRITPPIPLKAPRRGRVIPVLAQVLDDLNIGVGGYHVETAVQGSGSLVGIPITDHAGNGLIQVACEGSELYVPSPPFEWSMTGSPDATVPSLGLVDMVVSCRAYRPDPSDIPVTGVPGAPPGGFGGTPGSPVEGGPGPLPATAPNMIGILNQVRDSRPWRLDEIFEDEPDGRGAYTEAAVQACHDQDARFGHVTKHGAQNQYNGHAVDALNFLCDDGTTAEIYDIVAGGAHPGPSWLFTGRSAASRAIWHYPA